MPVITVSTWDNIPTEADTALQAERDAYNTAAVAAGKTEQLMGVQTADKSFTRTWANQTAANEWEAFITDLADRHGFNVTVVKTVV
jgi:hypothetical protein